MKRLLLFDNCLVWICNMGCKYCRKRSFKYLSQNIIKSDEEIVDLVKLEGDVKKISLLAKDVFDIPILKISGCGEFFLLPQALQILKIMQKNYERIQIITNATLLNEDIISKISEIKGINVCVSLDGHTSKLNACRTKNKHLIKKILNNIQLLRRYNIPVEINSVLTRYNISGFVEFIEYLSDRYDKLTCYPFPVKGANSLSVWGEEAAEELLPLLDSYKRFSSILPHEGYIKRLISFISTRGRQNKCYIGYANLGIEPDGNILVCACSIKEALGNILEKDPISTLKQRNSHPAFYKFLFKEFSFKECRQCFTHYEIINLCLDGTIALDEIARIPLFSGERTKEALKEIRNELAGV